jgi:hypothetical protein
MATNSNEVWVQEGDVKRQLEGKELEAYLKDRAEIKAEVKAAEDAAKAKSAQKVALLEKLGITEDEAKLLLG